MLNPSYRNFSTPFLQRFIANRVKADREEVERIWKELERNERLWKGLSLDLTFQKLKEIMENPKNWKLTSSRGFKDEITKVFDLTPLNGRIRCSISFNLSRSIISYFFYVV